MRTEFYIEQTKDLKTYWSQPKSLMRQHMTQPNSLLQ